LIDAVTRVGVSPGVSFSMLVVPKVLSSVEVVSSSSSWDPLPVDAASAWG